MTTKIDIITALFARPSSVRSILRSKMFYRPTVMMFFVFQPTAKARVVK